jgi:hypothetical protein
MFVSIIFHDSFHPSYLFTAVGLIFMVWALRDFFVILFVQHVQPLSAVDVRLCFTCSGFTAESVDSLNVTLVTAYVFIRPFIRLHS